MVRSAAEAVKVAKRYTRFSKGYCQIWTRTVLGANSVGDVDRDGDADAVDGWKSEPAWAKHTDRNPPAGAPVAFSGGSRGFGHRALSLGNGMIRGTDMYLGRYRAGTVGNATIAQIESAMKVRYLGWSETISGHKIPGLVKKEPKPKPAEKSSKTHTRGNKVDHSLDDLVGARKGLKKGSPRDNILKAAIVKLREIKQWKRKKAR